MRVARVVLATIVACFCREMRGLIVRMAQGTRASSSIAQGHYEEALLCFDQVLARHRRDLEILVKRGACYLNLNKPEKALADFDFVNRHTALATLAFGPRGIIDPNSTRPPLSFPDLNFAESWGNRGIALLMLDRNEEAHRKLPNGDHALEATTKPQGSWRPRGRVSGPWPVVSPTGRR